MKIYLIDLLANSNTSKTNIKNQTTQRFILCHPSRGCSDGLLKRGISKSIDNPRYFIV